MNAGGTLTDIMDWGTWQCMGGVQAPASDTPDDSEAAPVGTTATAVADFTQCTSLSIRERCESRLRGMWSIPHVQTTGGRSLNNQVFAMAY